MIKQLLEQELSIFSEAAKWAQDGLKKAPEGQLLVDASRSKPQFFLRKNPTEKKGTYLRISEDAKLIKTLAQKDYEQRLFKIASQGKDRLEKMLRQLPDTHELAAAYEQLPNAKKCLVDPFVIGDEEYAQQWQQAEYAGNSHPFGAYSFYTRRGERVRSKSEVIIADSLDAEGVPYRYEQPIYLEGFNPVYPDFTVLNKRTRKEYLWEHLGGMDDSDYRDGAMKKLNNYALAGIFPGQELLLTFESESAPLDTRVVAALIENYLK